jgi:hypothetical protein
MVANFTTGVVTSGGGRSPTHASPPARQAKVLTRDEARRMGHPMLDVGRTDGAGRSSVASSIESCRPSLCGSLRRRKFGNFVPPFIADNDAPHGSSAGWWTLSRQARPRSEKLQVSAQIGRRCRPGLPRTLSYCVRHIEPTIGHKRILDVTTADIVAIHQTLTRDGKPYQANRTVVLCHGIFELAIQLGYLPKDATNPASGVRHNREQPRHHRLEGPYTPGRIGRRSRLLKKLSCPCVGDGEPTCIGNLDRGVVPG